MSTMDTTERHTLTPHENLERAAVLDHLARLDGRGEPGHPHRELYTGLARPFTRLMALEGAFATLEELVAAIATLQARVEALEAAQAPAAADVEL